MLTRSILAFCVFGIVSKTVIHMVAASCHVGVVTFTSCLRWRHPLLDERLRLIMIGMNNPRTERRGVERGKGSVLAKDISREKVDMDFGARLKYLLPPRFQGIGGGAVGGGRYDA